MPTEAGVEGMIYVVTDGDDRGMYIYKTDEAKYQAVLSFKDFLTATGNSELENKTIDASKNTISNLEVDNFADGVVQTTVRDSENASDEAVATEKAIRTALDTKVDKVEGKSLVSDTEIAKLETVEEGANNYVHPESGVVAGTYNKVTVDANGHVTSASAETTLVGLGIADAYTKNEVDSALSNLASGLNWKDAVATYDDIATTYPDPVDGDTVSVKDTNDVYRYDEESASWINLFQAVSNEVEPSDAEAGTAGHSGLMTAAMAEKLAKVEAGAQVNQNAYAKVKVGDTVLSAAEESDSVEFATGDGPISVSAAADEDGNKVVTFDHDENGLGEVTGTFNAVKKADKYGHVTEVGTVNTLKEFGQLAGIDAVTADADDIVSMAGYEALAEAPADSAISASDSLNQAVAKLEYRANNMATELQSVLDGKVDKTQITQTIDENSTETQVASAKAIYEALVVVRI
jgi:hypothetical protein